MIGSVLLHIALFVVVTNMLPAAPVAVRAVDAFIVESPVARLTKPKRSIHPKSGRSIHTQVQVQRTGRLQPLLQGGESESPSADQKAGTAATPSNNSPYSTPLQPVQSMDRAAAVLHAAAISPLSDRPQVESQGGITSVPSGQNSGAEKVMTLGDAGSPRFIHRESPKYPFMARKLGKEGKVLLKLALDAQGRLQGIDTVEANGFGFAEAASSAIKKSTFAPAVRNGKAISSQVLVSVRFVLQ